MLGKDAKERHKQHLLICVLVNYFFADSLNIIYVILRESQQNFIYLFIYLFNFIFCLFRAVPTACGDSQAKGPIGAVATAVSDLS